MLSQRTWQRITLLTVLGYEGAGALAPRLSGNQPTPLIGVWERINIAVFLLWVIVLAIALLWRGHPSRRSARVHELQPA